MQYLTQFARHFNLMAHDETQEVKQRLWDGSINITVVLEFSKLGEKSNVDYLLTIYRNSYFPIYFDSIITYFKNFIDIKEPIWLSYNNQPIKWNLPVGILYDSMHSPSSINSQPWKVKFNHGNSYPFELIPFIYKYPDDSTNYEKSLTENFFNQIKQSCHIMNGNSKLMMNLSKDDSETLWNSVKDHDLNAFATITSKLTPRNIKRIPVKLWDQGRVFHSQLLEIDTLRNICKLLAKSYFIQGIEVTPELGDQSLVEIWNLFKYLDGFLYIVVD